MNFLISFPRSGSTFLRHIIENSTNKSTIDIGDGRSLINKNNPTILYKSHMWIQGDSSKNLLLIRDYKYCIYSHYNRNVIKKEEDIQYYLKCYLKLLDYYENFNGEKCIIYYEDLIKDTYNECIKIFRFFNINNEIIIDKYKSKSIYDKMHGNIINYGFNNTLFNIPLKYKKYLKLYME